MMLLTLPLALLVVSGLLALTTRLEQRRAGVTVRWSMRTDASPETCEALAAAELAPVLAAQGLLNRVA